MEVNLKSNGWYNKLQEFVLGDAKPDLFSLCPYFWLTIFCIFAAPVAAIIKVFKFVFRRIKQNLIDPIIANYINNMTLEDAMLIKYGEDYDKHKKASIFMLRKKSYDLFQAWKQKQLDAGKSEDELRTALREAYKKWKEARQEAYNKAEEARRALKEANTEAEAKKKARKERLKKAWIPIVKWTQRIVNIIVTLFLMFCVTMLIHLAVIYYNGVAAWSTLLVILQGLMWIGIAFGIGYLIYLYITWCKTNNRVPLMLKPFVWLGTQIGKGFKWIGNDIGGFFGLFWTYFKANKNDYCPAINWDTDKKDSSTTDETSPKG